MRKLTALIFLVTSAIYGQQDISLLAPPRIVQGSILPASCVSGDLFWLTGVVVGQNLYGCTSTNTWTLLSSGGSGAASVVITHTFTGTQEIAYAHNIGTVNPLYACQLAGSPFTGVAPGINVTTPATTTTTYVTATDVSLTCAFGTNGGGGGGGTVTSIATSSPLGGGTITTSGTLTCVTCVTSAASLTSNAVVIGGGSQASSTISASTTTTNALYATAGAPAFRNMATTDMPANTLIRGIPFSYGDPALANPISSGSTTTDYITVPYACTLNAWNLLVDAGTVTVKFWKIATGTSIPSSGNSINTSGVSVSTGTNVHSSTMSDFTTTTVTANDVMAMNITAASGVRFVRGVLGCTQ